KGQGEKEYCSVARWASLEQEISLKFEQVWKIKHSREVKCRMSSYLAMMLAPRVGLWMLQSKNDQVWITRGPHRVKLQCERTPRPQPRGTR
ncbi:hypothetical protein HAX54_031397, partial [Datura stramonium]|nr:hypothetical protein [Datura stramonium]